MPETNDTCLVCGGTWGEPRPVGDYIESQRQGCPISKVCPADCHDEAQWAALKQANDSIIWHMESARVCAAGRDEAVKLNRELCEEARGLRAQLTIERTRIAELEQDREQVRLRLGCIARVSHQHGLHACPNDDCLECWPSAIAKELANYAAREEKP